MLSVDQVASMIRAEIEQHAFLGYMSKGRGAVLLVVRPQHDPPIGVSYLTTDQALDFCPDLVQTELFTQWLSDYDPVTEYILLQTMPIDQQVGIILPRRMRYSSPVLAA